MRMATVLNPALCERMKFRSDCDCSGSTALLALLNQKALGWAAPRTLLLLDDSGMDSAAPIPAALNRRRGAGAEPTQRSFSLLVLDVDGDGALDAMVSVKPPGAV
jgi:hypothetical protein